MVTVVVGSQGSGKSTHAQYIASKLGIPYVSTGEILRTIAGTPTSLGEKVKEILANGNIVDDETTMDAFKEYLIANDIGEEFVLEGFPRVMSQVPLVPYPVKQIFEFVLDESIAIERLHQRGRHDDSPEVIKQRLNNFKEKTLPVIEHYKKSGVPVFVINNEPPIEEVQKEIDGLLKN